MKIYKTTEGYYTFKKDKYMSPLEIRELYEKKLDIPQEKQGKDLPQRIREAYVTGDELGSFLRLRRAKEYDPRYPRLYFSTEEAAKKASVIAERLHKMSDEEFLYSGLPYTFLDEIGSYNIKTSEKTPLTPRSKDTSRSC